MENSKLTTSKGGDILNIRLDDFRLDCGADFGDIMFKFTVQSLNNCTFHINITVPINSIKTTLTLSSESCDSIINPMFREFLIYFTNNIQNYKSPFEFRQFNELICHKYTYEIVSILKDTNWTFWGSSFVYEVDLSAKDWTSFDKHLEQLNI